MALSRAEGRHRRIHRLQMITLKGVASARVQFVDARTMDEVRSYVRRIGNKHKNDWYFV